ncbi:MAG: response regulator [Lachnospiraceae bacterium]|nr:response regulator [Lachnospiraceae bacterium]
MKRNLVNVFVFLLAAFLMCTGTTAAADGAETIEEQSINYASGGGYAASYQLPGVYFLPVLYDASNGLPTSEANCILCTSDGYIWIGGYSGIVKYDGVRFERLPVTDGLTSGRGLFEDSRGRVWVATNDSGVVVIDGLDRTRFTKADGLSSNSIRTFAEDAKGNVYIGSTAGVSYVDPDMKLHLIEDERIDNARILRLVSDVAGNVYGNTGNGQVFSISEKGIEKYYTSEDLFIGQVTTILADPKAPETLYFGTSSNRIYHGRVGETAGVMDRIDTGDAENIHWLHYACDRLWVTTVKVAGYVDENNDFIPFTSVPIKDSYEMMTSDYQGNMWFASSRYGVMKLVSNNFLDITGAAGIDPEVTNTTCKVGANLYIGTDDGLRIVDRDYHEIENKFTEYFKGSRIRSIIHDRIGNTWFSTFTGGHGLVWLDRAGKLTDINVYQGMPTNEIRCAYEMKDGRIVVGTNKGVAVVTEGKVGRIYNSSDGLSNMVILTICEGDDGEIIAGSDGDGLYIIKNGKVTHLSTEDGLGSDVIMRVKRDEKHGVIWVITSSSVDYIRNGKIENVSSFPYNNNFDVVVNENDDLWFLSSMGIYVVNGTSAIHDDIKSYKLYDTAGGLTSVPISHCYSGLDDAGNLYIAGQTGVSVVNINNFKNFSNVPKVGVRSITYDGEEILPDHTGTYRIPEGTGRIQIVPAVLDYTVSDPFVSMHLEGLDQDGITANQSKMTALEYTRLNYGNYVLHIEVKDARNRNVITGRKYTIVKIPGFIERQSVQVIGILFLIAAIGIAVWRILTGTVIKKQYVQIQEARDEAERANSAKSRFLANMSHEIRTPINTIMGMDEMILREDTKTASREYYGPVTGYARNIKYASESLLNLINDLLDISKIESGKMHLVEQEYDTVELLRGLTTMIRGRADDRKLYFDLEIDETLPRRLYGDGGKIKQIVLNLLTNAVKYTDEGGFTLSIRVIERTEAGVSLQISVKDTGIGVKKEDLDKLFSAYERLDEVKNSNIQGTGLGLDISKQFAELMGGKLWCESVYGEGSEFIFTLKQKIVDSAGIGVFIEESPEGGKSGYKPSFIAPDADILVVDDTPMNLNVIKGLLKPTKVFVTTAGSGEECLAKIASNDFNVVLLDHMMPGMDGLETLEKIRETHPDLPVYALTANATSGGEEFYVSKGFNGYLTKPIDIVAVEHAIMRHLPEKMMSKPTEEDVVEEDNTLTEDLEWVKEAEGISAEDGIKNSGGASQYAFTLKLFYDNIDDNSAVIEKAYADGDLKLATVKVHALKSSARIIGALKLSEACQALENAGNAGDMEYIEANRDKVLSDYRAFKDILKRVDVEEETEFFKPDISPSDLKDAYSALKDVIPQMDFDSVEMILMQLHDFKLQPRDEQIISEIETAFKNVDWDKMEEVIGNV